MTDREKVIKGVMCCAESKCEVCPYENQCFGDEICLCSPMAKDAAVLLKEYDDALKLMVYQYCTMKPLTLHDEVFHNRFMSAGEAAFRLLGLENGQSTDGVWERWFPNG